MAPVQRLTSAQARKHANVLTARALNHPLSESGQNTWFNNSSQTQHWGAVVSSLFGPRA